MDFFAAYAPSKCESPMVGRHDAGNYAIVTEFASAFERGTAEAAADEKILCFWRNDEVAKLDGSIRQSADFAAGKGAEAERSVGLEVHCDEGKHDAREPSFK